MAETSEWPQEGDTYYGVEGKGDVFSKVWRGDERDLGYAQYFSLFRTRRDAEFYKDHGYVERSK